MLNRVGIMPCELRLGRRSAISSTRAGLAITVIPSGTALVGWQLRTAKRDHTSGQECESIPAARRRGRGHAGHRCVTSPRHKRGAFHRCRRRANMRVWTNERECESIPAAVAEHVSGRTAAAVSRSVRVFLQRQITPQGVYQNIPSWYSFPIVHFGRPRTIE
jgi:hypothetical protein